MISVAYINDDHTMLEYGRQYLEYLGSYSVEIFDSLKYTSEWFPYHSYDVIIFRDYSAGLNVLETILSVLPNGDSTPIIILKDLLQPHPVPEVHTTSPTVIMLKTHKDLPVFFFELHQLIEQVVGKRKITESIKSLDILFKDSKIVPDKTFEENITTVVETCGRSLSAVLVAYHQSSDTTQPPVAVWYAGELPLHFASAAHASIPTRSQKIKKGRISSGWTCSPDGRIEWAGKEGTFSVVMYPVRRHECQKGVLSLVFLSNYLPADHELLMVETFADMISWHEEIAPQFRREANA